MAILTIGKSHPAFYTVHWLAKAVYKGTDREQLSVITVKDGKGYATDGKRMHIAEGIDLKEGVYKIHRNTKQEIVLETCDVTPPLYDRVIPESDRLSELLRIATDISFGGIQEGAVVFALARSSPSEVQVHLGYLLDALDIEESHANEFCVQWSTKGDWRTLVIAYKSLYGLRKAVVAGVSA
jgi:hypothetical protein